MQLLGAIQPGCFRNRAASVTRQSIASGELLAASGCGLVEDTYREVGIVCGTPKRASQLVVGAVTHCACAAQTYKTTSEFEYYLYFSENASVSQITVSRRTFTSFTSRPPPWLSFAARCWSTGSLAATALSAAHSAGQCASAQHVLAKPKRHECVSYTRPDCAHGGHKLTLHPKEPAALWGPHHAGCTASFRVRYTPHSTWCVYGNCGRVGRRRSDLPQPYSKRSPPAHEGPKADMSGLKMLGRARSECTACACA